MRAACCIALAACHVTTRTEITRPIETKRIEHREGAIARKPTLVLTEAGQLRFVEPLECPTEDIVVEQSANEIKDPPPNVTTIRRASELGIGLSVGGGSIGDTITLRYLRPDGSVSFAPTEMFTQAYRHSYWYWNYPLGDELGTWTIEVLANKKLARRFMVTQVP